MAAIILLPAADLSTQKIWPRQLAIFDRFLLMQLQARCRESCPAMFCDSRREKLDFEVSPAEMLDAVQPIAVR